MSENKKKLNMIIIGTLLVSTIVMSSISGVFISKNSKNRDNYIEAYNDYIDAQLDYTETLSDLTATEEDLADAETNLQNALDNLQSAETELQLIEDNTDFSGSFYILSQYNQDYGFSKIAIKTTYSYSSYFFYRLSLEHPSHSSSSLSEIAQLIAGYCRPTSVSSLATFISNNVDHPLDDECVIDGLLTFCQDRGDFEDCIHYVEDGEDDFSKYPVETLCEGCGDCEDKSILFASLVRALGYDVRICVVTGHVFVAVKLDSAPTHGDGWHIDRADGKYYTCETTGYGWLIGDLPAEYQGITTYSYQVL